MKILVLQLARYGDILQTIPALNALKRNQMDCEIHLMARSRFAAVLSGFSCIDQVKELDTRHILEPIIIEEKGLDDASARLDLFIESLIEENYDRIINLSYSPVSSFITHAVANDATVVSGYTRQTDGFLAIPDDPSAYFYAQVGVGRFNRIHLTDVFAAVVGFELAVDDFSVSPDLLTGSHVDVRHNELTVPSEPFLILHPGASQITKTYSSFKWRQVLTQLKNSYDGQFVLVGSSDEVVLGQSIATGDIENRVVNLIGKTTLVDLFSLASRAQGVVGGDSLLMHVASLTGTPCLNISFRSVNFWETGPRAPESRIVVAEDADLLASDKVANEISALLTGDPAGESVFVREMGSLPGYVQDSEVTVAGKFEWEFIQAIYMGNEFPSITNVVVAHGIQRLAEVSRLAIEQLHDMQDEKKRPVAMEMFGQVDNILKGIENMVPSLQPLIGWFQTERLRIGPGSYDQVLAKTEKCFNDLIAVLAIYLGPNPGGQWLQEDDRGNSMDAK